jgi:hypothetical protein
VIGGIAGGTHNVRMRSETIVERFKTTSRNFATIDVNYSRIGANYGRISATGRPERSSPVTYKNFAMTSRSIREIRRS